MTLTIRGRAVIGLAAIAVYLGSVVLANWLTTRYGFLDVGFGYAATAGTFAAGVVACWGSSGPKSAAPHLVELATELRTRCDTYVLAVNKDGQPKHPLYCRNDSDLTRWTAGS